MYKILLLTLFEDTGKILLNELSPNLPGDDANKTIAHGQTYIANSLKLNKQLNIKQKIIQLD